MKIKLLGIDDGSLDFRVTFDGTPVKLGRHPDADVRINDASVSHYHCEIDQVNGVLWVRDLGSSHGTFVNGFHVAQSHLLPDDELTVGATSLRISYERVEVDWFSDYERVMALV